MDIPNCQAKPLQTSFVQYVSRIRIVQYPLRIRSNNTNPVEKEKAIWKSKRESSKNRVLEKLKKESNQETGRKKNKRMRRKKQTKLTEPPQHQRLRRTIVPSRTTSATGVQPEPQPKLPGRPLQTSFVDRHAPTENRPSRLHRRSLPSHHRSTKAPSSPEAPPRAAQARQIKSQRTTTG